MSDLIVIDYESLGTSEDAVILSQGIVSFKEEWLEEIQDAVDPLNTVFEELFWRMIKNGLYLKLDVASQVKNYGRKISTDTLDWWKQQGDEAQSVLNPKPDDMSLVEMNDKTNAWLKENSNSKMKVYTRGMIDARWYQSMIEESLGLKCGKNGTIPWWNFRDVRTAVDELLAQDSNGYLPKTYKHLVDVPGLVKHDSLHDAALDALNIVVARILCFAPDIIEEDIPF